MQRRYITSCWVAACFFGFFFFVSLVYRPAIEFFVQDTLIEKTQVQVRELINYTKQMAPKSGSRKADHIMATMFSIKPGEFEQKLTELLDGECSLSCLESKDLPLEVNSMKSFLQRFKEIQKHDITFQDLLEARYYQLLIGAITQVRIIFFLQTLIFVALGYVLKIKTAQYHPLRVSVVAVYLLSYLAFLFAILDREYFISSLVDKTWILAYMVMVISVCSLVIDALYNHGVICGAFQRVSKNLISLSKRQIEKLR